MRLLMIPAAALLLGLAGCTDSSAGTDTSAADAARHDSTTTAAETTTDTHQHAAADDEAGAKPQPPEGRVARPSLTTTDLAPPPKTRPVDILDGAVTVDLPDPLMPMNESELSMKYEGESRPDVAFTDATTRINFTATITDVFLKPEQIYEYKGLMEADFRRLYPGLELISNEEIGVDGGPCFMIQFRHALTDTVVHNIVLGASYENKLLMMTVNFPMQEEQRWIPIGRKLLLSADFHRSGKDGQPTDEESAALEAADE